MRTANNYTTESLGRALAVHTARGIVKEWSPPEAGRTRWHVHLTGNLSYFEWTSPMVYAFVVGCAEAYRIGQDEGFSAGFDAGQKAGAK